MKPSKRNIKVILVLVILLFSCSLLHKWYSNGCLLWGCVPERSVKPENILIPEIYFPENSDVGELIKDRGLIYADEYYQGCSWENGSSFFEIVRWNSVRRAIDHFDYRQRNIKFTSYDFPVDLVYPILNLEVKGANQYAIKCGFVSWDLECKFLSRYDEYYLYFMASIDSKMQPEDFIEIVKYIDENMTYLLKQ